MSKFLAIDWDRSEARFIYASTGGRGAPMRILAAESISLPEAGERSPKDLAIEVGSQLRTVLDRHNIGRVPVLVSIERTGLELLQLSLPPASDNELPDMVANEVLRESPSAADGGAFDYAVFGDDSTTSRKLMVAILPPDLRVRVDAMLESARLRPEILLPRFFAVASMFRRLVTPSEEWHLVIHPSAEEVDFLVFRLGKATFVRTARLPIFSDDNQRDAWMESEIQRTLTVATTEAGETRIVEGVYIFSSPVEFEKLCERIREGLLLPAHCLNPLENYELPAEFAPEHPGRFTALLGMLNDGFGNVPPIVDFLHPHRPPQRVSRYKIFSAVAAIAVILATLGGVWYWDRLSKVWEKNAELASELKKLDTEIAQDAKMRKLVNDLYKWQGNDVIWLDELRSFSERFLPARDACVLRMQMASPAAGASAFVFQGLVRDPSLIVRLEYALSDASHVVQSRRIQTGSRPGEDYSHLFDASVVITKHQEEESSDDAKGR
jgi:hypothetical protein